MQFSDTSNLTGVVEDIDFLCGTDSTSYALKDKARNVNERYRKIWSWIFDVSGGWIWDDTNQTDLPQATANLTSGTSTYALPSTALTVKGIEIKDSAGNWIKLKPTTLEEINEKMAVDEFHESDGTPIYYRLVGTTIELFPGPNYNSTNGIKVYFDRDVSTFASTDTTKTPGFAAPYHRALSVGAALDWAIAQGRDALKEQLELEWVRYEQAIKKFYAERFKAKGRPQLRPHVERYD